MNLGSHVSIAGGIFNAPINSQSVGGSIFQIFSRSPRGGPAPKLTAEIVADFKKNLTDCQQKTFYIHAPYYINFGSPKKNIFTSTVNIIRDELERASTLNAKAIMTHLGSATGSDRQTALKQTAVGLNEILNDYTGNSLLLLENAAGSGEVLGDTLNELSFLIKSLSVKNRKKVGVCLDTCHAFASGYNIANKKSLNEFVTEFDKLIGLDKLVVIHANDSKTPLGDKKDRHEHIGKGHIGLEGFKNIVNHPKLKKLDYILETPIDDDGDHSGDLKILKKLFK
jgi:deoxyribonuclease-4